MQRPPLLTELQEPADAHLAYEDENGDLLYGAYDELGQTIGEWGRVGYQNGEEPIPFIENGTVMIPMDLAREVLNKKTEEELLALAGTSTQKDGETYLPLRKVFEVAGLNVYYHDGTSTVTDYDNYFMTDEEIQSVLRSVNIKF